MESDGRPGPVGSESDGQNEDGTGEDNNPLIQKEDKLQATKTKIKRRSKKVKNERNDEDVKEIALTDNSPETTKISEDKDGKTMVNAELKKFQEKSKNEKLEMEVPSNRDDEKDSSTNAEKDGDTSDDEALLSVDRPDVETRNALYNKGLRLFQARKRTRALPYFLRCITGVIETGEFQYFPHCLKKIAEIYYSQENYEKAIQFIQAEKLYYETALISSSRIGSEPGERSAENNQVYDDGTTKDEGLTRENVRADEYEKLAKLCLDKKQPELALEYQGKATQIRQNHLGNDHPLTKKSLDFFTVVYAEVGKQEYSDTLKKTLDQKVDGTAGSEAGILKKRENTKKDDDRHVRFQEPPTQEETDGSAVWRSVLLVLLATSVLILMGLMLYLYCRLDLTSHYCASWKSQLHYYYMKCKFLYYTWNPHPKYKFG